MNEMNDLELLLNSWAPRRPSPKLRRRIFDAPPAIAAHAARITPQPLTPRFIWLAPAAACLLLAVAIVSQRNGPGFSRQASAMPMVGVILSNQSYAAFIPSRFQTEQNSLRNTFEWTNLSRSATTRGFLSPMKEND